MHGTLDIRIVKREKKQDSYSVCGIKVSMYNYYFYYYYYYYHTSIIIYLSSVHFFGLFSLFTYLLIHFFSLEIPVISPAEYKLPIIREIFNCMFSLFVNMKFLETCNSLSIERQHRHFLISKLSTIAIHISYYIFCCRNKTWTNLDLLPV